MPCDCPDERPRLMPSAGCNYLVYSGGPLSSFYRLVEHAIPDVEMTHGRPTVHPDGALEFSGPPPELSGCRRDGQRLYPAWPTCALRMLKVQVVDRVLSIAGVCGNPKAQQFTQEATPEHCQNCPIRLS